jgi:hypothetical protein
VTALVAQLRLRRDTLRGIPEVPAPAIALLNEMLVRQQGLPARAKDTVAAERAYWHGYAAAVSAEAVPAVTAMADEFDTTALQAWLRTLPGEAAVRVLEARTASRGFSKKTVVVRLAQGAVLPDEIALRIDQKFNYLATTVVDEYPWLAQLWKHGARIAQPFALEASGRVLGQPFLVSAKVGGGAVGGNYAPPPRNAALLADAAAVLAGIHAVPLGDLGGALARISRAKSTPMRRTGGRWAKPARRWRRVSPGCGGIYRSRMGRRRLSITTITSTI